MKILVIGAHGKVGKRLIRCLINEGHRPIAMIRNKKHMKEMKKLGAETVIADLEEDFFHAYENVEAIIFTAGSGGHTGPEKTISVDQEGAIKSIDLAEKMGIKRYIMVSAQGSREPEQPSEIQHYYKAKAIADERLMKSSLNYTIFRPGRLLDDAGKGYVLLSSRQLGRSSTSRDNLAQTIAVSVMMKNTFYKVIEIVEGSIPIREALLQL